jgi:hypothetical protein
MLIAFLISQRGVASKGLSAVRREDARNYTHTIMSVQSRAVTSVRSRAVTSVKSRALARKLLEEPSSHTKGRDEISHLMRDAISMQSACNQQAIPRGAMKSPTFSGDADSISAARRVA